MPFAPGAFEYECDCLGCDLNFPGVASIPDFFDNYCECLCQNAGCGGAGGGEITG